MQKGIKQGQGQSTHMIQIPKAGVQTPEQDPQEKGNIYFSLENQINLVQASQTPEAIEMHSKEVFCQSIAWIFIFTNQLKPTQAVKTSAKIIRNTQDMQTIT